MYLQGHIPHVALKVIGSTLKDHALLWCPGHEGISGNEQAHTLARGFINQAGDTYSDQIDDFLLVRDILEHQRRTQQQYAPPHKLP